MEHYFKYKFQGHLLGAAAPMTNTCSLLALGGHCQRVCPLMIQSGRNGDISKMIKVGVTLYPERKRDVIEANRWINRRVFKNEFRASCHEPGSSDGRWLNEARLSPRLFPSMARRRLVSPI